MVNILRKVFRITQFNNLHNWICHLLIAMQIKVLFFNYKIALKLIFKFILYSVCLVTSSVTLNESQIQRNQGESDAFLNLSGGVLSDVFFKGNYEIFISHF